jgi:hypothetical protein
MSTDESLDEYGEPISCEPRPAPRIRCRDCRNLMTWAASRVQYGRALRRGLTVAEAKAAQPRCQKCTTKFLKAKQPCGATP